jgi:Winged helix DNA-binding domain
MFSARTPHSFPTFLVDGAVAGRWRYDRGEIVLEPFGPPLDSAVERELREAAQRLAALHS